VIGLTPPPAVPYFRGIVMAHLEFTANGVLLIAIGTLVNEMQLTPLLWKIWFVSLQLGTWCNGASGVISAVTGATSQLSPTMNEKFPPPHGSNSSMAANSLLVCAIGILTGLMLTMVGLMRNYSNDAGNNNNSKNVNDTGVANSKKGK